MTAENTVAVPQFEFSTYPAQAFWLTVTYIVFYFLLTKLIIPRLQNVIQKREHMIESVSKEITEMAVKRTSIEEKCNEVTNAANLRAHKLTSMVREDAKKNFENAYSSISADMMMQLQDLDSKIRDTKRKNQEMHDQYADEISQSITSAITKDITE